MKSIAILLLLLTFSSSCQTLDIAEKKPTCEDLDWFELGRSDGAQGLISLNWQKREVACQEFSESHHQSYVNGWYAGVDDFCSESHGFAFGKTGHKYFDVCPTSKEAAFLKSYRKGIKVFLYESDNKRISTELKNLSEKTTSAEPTEAPSLLKMIGDLEGKKELNRVQISEIENEMESSVIETSTL